MLLLLVLVTHSTPILNELSEMETGSNAMKKFWGGICVEDSQCLVHPVLAYCDLDKGMASKVTGGLLGLDGRCRPSWIFWIVLTGVLATCLASCCYSCCVQPKVRVVHGAADKTLLVSREGEVELERKDGGCEEEGRNC